MSEIRYLDKLKKDSKNIKEYSFYYEVKEYVRNAFSEVKSNYKSENQISFYVPSNKTTYLIIIENNKTYFRIINNGQVKYQANIPSEIKKSYKGNSKNLS